MAQSFERYKDFSDIDLLRMIEHDVDYRPEAVAAAQREIDRRNLSDECITEAKRRLESESKEKHTWSVHRASAERKAKDGLSSIFDAINPIQLSLPPTEKRLRWIILIFGFIALYQCYLDWALIRSLVTDSQASWDASVRGFLLPLLLLPMALLFLWLQESIGWILMVIYLSYRTVEIIAAIVFMWKMDFTPILPYEDLQPDFSLVGPLMKASHYAGTLWILSQKATRVFLNVNRRAEKSAIVASAAWVPLVFATLALM